MHTFFKKSLATGLNILFTGTKVLLSGALCVAVFFIFVFMYVTLSPETFLERPRIPYSILTTLPAEKNPCSEQEIPVKIFSSTKTTHIFLRGKLHAYYPLYLKEGLPNDQPFVLNIVPSIDPDGSSWQTTETTVCLPLPPGPLPCTPKDLNWDLLFDEVTKQSVPPVGPPFIASKKALSLPFLENPYLGSLFSLILFGLGFAGAACKVFRNPKASVPPTFKLFLFPALLALLLLVVHLLAMLSPLSSSAILIALFPFPLLFTYPLIVLCYGLAVQFFHTKPNDFWSRTLFFFLCRSFFWICLSHLYLRYNFLENRMPTLSASRSLTLGTLLSRATRTPFSCGPPGTGSTNVCW